MHAAHFATLRRSGAVPSAIPRGAADREVDARVQRPLAPEHPMPWPPGTAMLAVAAALVYVPVGLFILPN